MVQSSCLRRKTLRSLAEVRGKRRAVRSSGKSGTERARDEGSPCGARRLPRGRAREGASIERHEWLGQGQRWLSPIQDASEKQPLDRGIS